MTDLTKITPLARETMRKVHDLLLYCARFFENTHMKMTQNSVSHPLLQHHMHSDSADSPTQKKTDTPTNLQMVTLSHLKYVCYNVNQSLFSTNKRKEVATMSTQADHVIEAAKQLSLDELKTVSERILDMFHDRKWDELLATPESDAYLEKLEEELKADIAAGRIIKYIPGKSLAELFGPEI